jgi:hypothetical protein
LKELEVEVARKEKEWKERREVMDENAAKVPSLIKMHVGCKSFIFPKATLLEYKGSYFESMLSSSQQVNGEYYIDYRSDNFKIILDFMRTKSLPKIVTMDKKKIDELKIDFSFFGLAYPPPFHSDLLPIHLEEILADWIPNCNFSLLYKATRDGFEPEDFHNTCDNKGPTITIIKTKKGYLCGGYSPLPWTSQGTRCIGPNPDYFLFTLTNPHNVPPTRYKFDGYHRRNNGTDHINFASNKLYIFSEFNVINKTLRTRKSPFGAVMDTCEKVNSHSLEPHEPPLQTSRYTHVL